MKFKNKEELLKAYEKLEKEFTKKCQRLKELEQLLNAREESKIWQPKENEVFWYIAVNSEVDSFYVNNIAWTETSIENGNYFKTEEEAKKQAEYNKVMNRFRKYVEAYSEPLDWEDDKQFKWWIKFKTCTKTLEFNCSCINPSQFQIYASSAQVLKDAIIYSAGSEEEFIRIVFNKGEK